MTEPRLDLAPGCFGSPVCFGEANQICATCIFKAQCKPDAERRLAELHAHFGIEPKKKRAKPQPPPEPALKQHPVHPRAEKMVRALKVGVNPFPKENAERTDFRIACHLLSKRPDIGRGDLALALERKLNWKPAQATERANHVLSALFALGVLAEKGGRFAVRSE